MGYDIAYNKSGTDAPRYNTYLEPKIWAGKIWVHASFNQREPLSVFCRDVEIKNSNDAQQDQYKNQDQQ